MKVESCGFDGLFVIELDLIPDDRGWFLRIYDSDKLDDIIPNFPLKWVQINQAYNRKSLTWRGFHYQRNPYCDAKLIRCIRGKVLDCVLDLRSESRTYLQVFKIELSGGNNKMLYVPAGFAHGYLTLEDESELLYLHDNVHSKEHESGIRFDDPKINFKLELKPQVISLRDMNHYFINKDFKGF